MMTILAQCGLPGLLVFVGMLAAVAFMCWCAARHDK